MTEALSASGSELRTSGGPPNRSQRDRLERAARGAPRRDEGAPQHRRMHDRGGGAAGGVPAAEALETDLVKLEILADPLTLYPNNAETVRCAAADRRRLHRAALLR